MTPLQLALQSLSAAMDTAWESVATVAKFKLGFLVGSVYRVREDIATMRSDLEEMINEVSAAEASNHWWMDSGFQSAEEAMAFIRQATDSQENPNNSNNPGT